tara:strand:+ start:3000 stop:3401 length:402 start_codon:yes stop_codon:yes gene_type:complete
MSLEKAVRAILIADGTTNGLVSSRIYPQRRPQGTALPAIIYSNIFDHETESLQTQSGLRRARMSVEVLATTYSGVKSLRNAVESALINYTGTTSGATIKSLRLESSVDQDEDLNPGSEFGAYRIILDFIIWYE